MLLDDLDKPRYQKHVHPDGITISIPSKKNWFLIVFIGFWMIIWTIGEVFVISIIITEMIKAISEGIFYFIDPGASFFAVIFLMFWLSLWTLSGLIFIYSLLWQIKGMEIITISKDLFIINKKLPLFSRTKEYQLKNVTGLRVSNIKSFLWDMPTPMEFWGIKGGRLAFDYGDETVIFGLRIGKPESKLIIDEINNNTDLDA